MAAVTSLGVHTPAALPYLISEGLLPPEPKQGSYKWDTYVYEQDGVDFEEEILSTDQVVVWTQGKFVKNVYRFDLVNENVKQAALTQFPASSVSRLLESGARNRQQRSELRHSVTGNAIVSPDQKTNDFDVPFARALVVILKTKAHLYFLQGSSHIIDLPFEIERAFPAPIGLLLQRKRAEAIPSRPTLQIPAAPPNSFFSSRGKSSQSFLQSPTLARSLGQSQPVRPSPLSHSVQLDTLFQNIILPQSRNADGDITNVYSLTNPLNDLGVVTFSVQQLNPRAYSKANSARVVEFEDLDPAENIIYISSKNELGHAQDPDESSLIIVVTLNTESEAITVWHAWYLEQKSLRTLLSQRAEQKAAKARRRSSFMSANLATGASTPAVRPRDGNRESLAGPNAAWPGGDLGVSQASAIRSRKPTKQEEEETMASQMDPDFQPVTTQQPVRESRRISSMNADVRASHQTVHHNIGAGGRRATSYGGGSERRSLGGHRRSRGSTPGSVYSRSIALDDDTMDLDRTTELDHDETIDEILQHIQATYGVTGIDSVFGCSDEGYKREIVLRKVHSCQATQQFASQGSPTIDANVFKVVTLTDPRSTPRSASEMLNIYIHNQATSEVLSFEYQIRSRALWPELAQSSFIAVPFLVNERHYAKCDDLLKIQERDMRAIVFGRVGIMFALDSAMGPLPSSTSYRIYDPFAVPFQSPPANKDIGRNRTVDPPRGPCTLLQAGAYGSFDETAEDGVRHRRRLQLRPKSLFVDKMLTVCEVALPRIESHRLRSTWCVALAWLREHPQSLSSTSADIEMVAVAATVFSFVVRLLGSRARAALNISKFVSSKNMAPNTEALKVRRGAQERRLFSSAVWTDIPDVQRFPSRQSAKQLENRKDQFVCIATALAFELCSASGNVGSTSRPTDAAYNLMLGLHTLREEQKLNVLLSTRSALNEIAPIIVQLGSLLKLEDWCALPGDYYALEGATEDRWAYVDSSLSGPRLLSMAEPPLGVFEWFERAMQHASVNKYPSLAFTTQSENEVESITSSRDTCIAEIAPRIMALYNLLVSTNGLSASPVATVEMMFKHGIFGEVVDTLPESVAAPLREAIAQCEKQPPTWWPHHLLQLIGREDLVVDTSRETGALKPNANIVHSSRDVHGVCALLDSTLGLTKTREASRHAVSQLLFSEDRRLVEAVSLMHFMSPQIAECPKQPEWDDATHLDHQRKMMHHVVTRMIALPPGDGMLHHNSQTPLLTERFILQGFSSSCVMQPMGHTLTTDRTGLTEEKLNWAYFHAGVASGMRVSRNAQGIDTSWVAFNKPHELTNRHAGLLLALGLAGHLRNLAKWLSFKYLTPKHTMTSIGLLLGLSASYLGTMDSLITRMLSVHITRMLPPGASELNVSPATQTAGLMGIGLLYYNTQHRRMSEIMLSEIEYMEIEDPDSGPDMLRDESYRLAAGFALGLINLGRGRDLQGLHGMQLPERLLAMAVGPRPVNAVHVFDRATAGAVMGIALIYMKTNDKAIASKIDIPDTEAQFDHVRPDVLLLRAMTKHIILWDSIDVDKSHAAVNANTDTVPLFPWITDNVPQSYRETSLTESILAMLRHRSVHSKYIPLLNIHTGLAWALSLKYAGTANIYARDEILALFGALHQLNEGVDAHYFDGKLGRMALKRCMDVCALAAATVMAGTGDLKTVRYLRRMHGRVDADTNYGSHVATHMAIGVLFLAGGTHTFGTGDLAIAMLMVAFYPLWPVDVLDNRVHLQAFRHLWTLAAEARCFVVEDIDTRRPLHMDIVVTMRNGKVREMRSPCLLPELDKVRRVRTKDQGYWPVTLDFESNQIHLEDFRKGQRVLVRRCPAKEGYTDAFSAALGALNAQSLSKASAEGMQATVSPATGSAIDWQTSLLDLPALQALNLSSADHEVILLSSDGGLDERPIEVDARLGLSLAAKDCERSRDPLWDLRVLFAWADRERSKADEKNGKKGTSSEKLAWLGGEVIEDLRARVLDRADRIEMKL